MTFPQMSQANEPMLAAVVRQLRQTKGDWPAVSSGSEVPYSTVVHIAQGRIGDPRVSTVQALFDYFVRRGLQPAVAISASMKSENARASRT